MERISKKYLKTFKEGTEVSVELYYDKGGMNYFTYKNEARGYYLSACPVEVERRDNGILIESFMAFSGVKKLVLECKRKSDKGAKEAVELASKMEADLLSYVCEKNQINVILS